MIIEIISKSASCFPKESHLAKPSKSFSIDSQTSEMIIVRGF